MGPDTARRRVSLVPVLRRRAPFERIPLGSGLADVLVVDDHARNRLAFVVVLTAAGYAANVAGDISDARAQLRQRRFHLVVTDAAVGEGDNGLTLLREIKITHPGTAVIVYGGYPSKDVAVRALRFGAYAHVELPMVPPAFIRTVENAIASASAPSDALAGMRDPSAQARLADARSADGTLQHRESPAERWAGYVLGGCRSQFDLRTVGVWARVLAVSRTTLSETCRLIHVKPKDARDFARVFRAVVRSIRRGTPPEVQLSVSDLRTLARLTQSSTIDLAVAADASTMTQFLRDQQFIEDDNPGLVAFRAAFHQWRHPDAVI
jgi:CheY-like chemotaxis protein